MHEHCEENHNTVYVYVGIHKGKIILFWRSIVLGTLRMLQFVCCSLWILAYLRITCTKVINLHNRYECSNIAMTPHWECFTLTMIKIGFPHDWWPCQHSVFMKQKIRKAACVILALCWYDLLCVHCPFVCLSHSVTEFAPSSGI